jgi:antitoxin (DNA-binding transcriptional repressor) of toxin-antitoxin stability system
MTEQIFPPVPEITIETLRRSLGACLDEVRLSGQQRIVLRRGHPVAGLVTVTEARALWTLDHESAVYSEWRMHERLDTLARRRDAVNRQAEAERRAAFERGVLGR